MTIRSREQDRAHAAMAAVQRLPDNELGAYVSRAQNLPSMIQNLGLAHTLSFLKSKTDIDRRLANDLSSWLVDEPDRSGVRWPGQPSGQMAVDRLLSAIAWDQGGQKTTWLDYRRAAEEAKHYGGWLKRWSKAREEAANAAQPPAPATPQATE